ncbi:MAG: helical backbone metal receptor [Actinocatenispora sp.]
MRDDLGEPVELAAAPRRVVSLVPSLTESVALSGPGILVGATDWCTEPAGLDVPRVGGSKYPRVEDVLACEPDLVLANAEENRPEDVAALRAAGVAVWVTYPRTVAEALVSLGRMFEVLRTGRPDWLDEATAAWAEPYRGVPRRAVVPVWRRPWVWLGEDTFATDVLRHLGVTNVLRGPDRYPRLDPDRALAEGPDLVVLPDEPYRFTREDGPEVFAPVPAALCSGRHLTWYGPSLVEARRILREQLATG